MFIPILIITMSEIILLNIVISIIDGVISIAYKIRDYFVVPTVLICFLILFQIRNLLFVCFIC